jgi:hypothetical protein
MTQHEAEVLANEIEAIVADPEAYDKQLRLDDPNCKFLHFWISQQLEELRIEKLEKFRQFLKQWNMQEHEPVARYIIDVLMPGMQALNEFNERFEQEVRQLHDRVGKIELATNQRLGRLDVCVGKMEEALR